MRRLLSYLPNRDHWIWTIGLVGSLAGFVAANTLPGLDVHKAHEIQDVAIAVASLCAKLSTSPLFGKGA